MAVCSIRCCFCCLLSLSVMINPHNDSAFYAYADWALAQEIAWDEEQEELEEEEEELEAPKGWTHWNTSTETEQ